jgi:hypothetical protein
MTFVYGSSGAQATHFALKSANDLYFLRISAEWSHADRFPVRPGDRPLSGGVLRCGF